MTKVITFGTFDLFHFGHLRILERAASYGSELYVGVSSDDFNYQKKGYYPLFTESERIHMISSLVCVTSVFLEESMEKKRDYIIEHNADILVMGDDWQGCFDELQDICQVIYLPRTPSISTSALIERIKLEY